MNDTPNATPEAFRELRTVVIALAGEEGWLRLEVDIPEADVPDEMFVNALNDADDLFSAGNGELARAVGVARAEALVNAESFEGDPFRFLKEGASSIFDGRSNYGASSVELAPKRALLRLVAPDYAARKMDEVPNRLPMMASAFLERAIERIAGEPQVPRYLGHAPRVDMRFNKPMANLLYEFDLDEG